MIVLVIAAIICSAVTGFFHNLTRDRIDANSKAARLRLINEVMTATHSNDLLEDMISVSDREFFSDDREVGVYRARSADGSPMGVVFMPVTARGYNGPVTLVIGISYSGTITGVRVGEQHETAGLGDRIDQNNSDWILGFENRSLRNTAVDGWTVRNNGGEFDQLSGATISPRAVIRQVKNTLDYYQIHSEELYR